MKAKRQDASREFVRDKMIITDILGVSCRS
jgi:hypothetical protein